MKLTLEKQKKILVALVAALALLIVYRVATYETPKTAPLTYTHGAVASSPIRPATLSGTAPADPLNAFLQRREEKFPGVTRDIFKMQNTVPKPKVVAQPITVPTPTVPVKTPEEIAAELARADLAKFRLLGSMTDKESSYFVSKNNESFIVKKGDTLQKSYKVKDTGTDYLILLDTVTRVEVRVELSGGDQKSSQQPGKFR